MECRRLEPASKQAPTQVARQMRKGKILGAEAARLQQGQ